jgi:tetratricopeptide (TPR) repeat protein
MINLAISLAAGLLVGLIVAVTTRLGAVAAIIPGTLVAVAAYLVLVRRSWKQLETIFDGVQKELQSQRVDKALQLLQAGFRLAPWQFLVASQLHSNIGILLFVKGDTEAALPHLVKSFTRNWIARAMLGVARYRARDLAGATRVLDEAVKVNKKEPLLWQVYAWILEKEDRHADAIALLGRAAVANPSDEKLKNSLQALQNGKKLKLGKLYAEQWFQFRLENVPPTLMMPGYRPGRRAIFRPR